MKRALRGACLLAFTMMAEPAISAVLTMNCKVRSAKPGYRREGSRRLQFDMAAKTVRISDNTGRGFQARGVRPILGVDGSRVTIENSGGKVSYLDRRTGQYYFRNDVEKLVIEGHCVLLGRDANPL